jgi:hypothetical protein
MNGRPVGSDAWRARQGLGGNDSVRAGASWSGTTGVVAPVTTVVSTTVGAGVAVAPTGAALATGVPVPRLLRASAVASSN